MARARLKKFLKIFAAVLGFGFGGILLLVASVAVFAAAIEFLIPSVPELAKAALCGLFGSVVFIAGIVATVVAGEG